MTANANGGLISNAALRVENKRTVLINKCACGMFFYRKLLFVIEGIIAFLERANCFCALLNQTKVALKPKVLHLLVDFGY